MTRGVRSDSPSWGAIRHRTMDRGSRKEAHYELRFAYTGGPYIDVRFAGCLTPHDVINIRDYSGPPVDLATREDFMAHVNEYMEGMDSDVLRNAWENRPRS